MGGSRAGLGMTEGGGGREGSSGCLDVEGGGGSLEKEFCWRIDLMEALSSRTAVWPGLYPSAQPQDRQVGQPWLTHLSHAVLQAAPTTQSRGQSYQVCRSL